jgi:tryptophanyl-tRNA synthetase
MNPNPLGDENVTNQQPPKQQRVIQCPTAPSAVTTAYLILRGAVMNVVGASLADVEVTPFQATFVKDAPLLTGKFGLNLGKKCGTLCAVDIPEDEGGQIRLLNAIERAANRIIQENLPVSLFECSPEALVSLYGESLFMMDTNEKKLCRKTIAEKSSANDDGNRIRCAYIPDTILSCIPCGKVSPVFPSTGYLSSIRLDTTRSSSQGCTITAGMKARKCDITIKFLAEVCPENMDLQPSSSGVSVVPIDPKLLQHLMERKVRSVEGVDLLASTPMLISNLSVQEETNVVENKLGAHQHPESSSAKNSTNKQPDEEEEEPANDNAMVVTAFEVKGKIDYDKLVRNFGSKLISDELLARFVALTVGKGKVDRLHRFLRRNIFFSHRDLEKICDCVEGNRPIYLYTGRGPSSGAMHLGHLVPFLMTQWLQQALDCPLVVQMTDDEKFLFKGEYSDEDGDNLEYFRNLTMENAKDILACGFDKNKTFIFSDLEYVGTMYPNIVRIWKAVNANTVNGIFGFDGQSNIGKVAFPAIQAAPSFPSSFPIVLDADQNSNMACLIPCAIDQDPYFRMTRDIAHKLVPKSHPLGGKPALLHSKFFPPLQGATGKMSSSDPNSAVFLTDTPEDIERKIKQYGFSGGRETKKLQMELGADLDVDVSYQWLRFFLEDDEELDRIGREYGSGSGEYWSTGNVKARLVRCLQDLVREHQERRSHLSDETVREWMTERRIVS